MKDDQGNSLFNSSILGPKDEGTDVEIICEASGGKPVPMVRWYNKTTQLEWAMSKLKNNLSCALVYCPSGSCHRRDNFTRTA
ncbi:hypothetical protein WA026_014612 [Henosepilachna vigintioctopunctata]|uniref:Ig-like domain-containing protein n=1 Tax=Henosepilachna vigintioctopunctata TaxID=420089 RepID=A0AAW1V9H6_9CUCU